MKNQKCIATKILILLNCLMFVYELITIGSGLLAGMSTPSEMLSVGAMNGNQILAEHQYLPLFTSMFVHLSLIHLVSNMLSLWILGNSIESAIGSIKFTIFYLISGIVGNLLTIKLSNPNIVSAGASGAIFGIMGLCLSGLLLHKLVSNGTSQSLAIKNIVEVILLNILNSIFNPGINLWAHLGGLVSGMILGVLV